MDTNIGYNEGQVCNRVLDDGKACPGIMKIYPVENCFCHISPPCFACTNNNPTCDECGESD